MKKQIIILIAIAFSSLLLLGFCDYFNLLTFFGFKIENLNIEIWNIIINSIIVIILYIITYILIDKRNIKQHQNKLNIVNLLLVDTYNNCLEDIKWLEKEDYRNAVLKNVDFDKKLNNNEVYKRIIEMPFFNQDLIFSYTKEGIIGNKEICDYFDIKKEFRKFINMVIVFYDKYELVEQEKNILLEKINQALLNLTKE